MFRILAFSDVSRWDAQSSLVAKYRPNVVVLAGDLTSDGTAAFWREALDAIPAYRKLKQQALRARGITVTLRDGFEVVRGGRLRDVMDIEREVGVEFQDSREFHEARHRLHTEPFYAFLKRAGGVAPVLVVRGDHDDDFLGDYDPDRINRTRGCREISGVRAEVGALTFLGLSFQDCERKTRLREVAAAGPVDVIVCHARQRVLRDVASIGARLIVRGHFGFGPFLVDGIPTAFSAGPSAVMDLPKRGPPRIRSSQGSSAYFTGRYPWLTAYPPSRGS